MNEAETRAELIDPALKAAGWGVVEGSRIRREVIAPGRLEGRGRRAKAEIADYVLVYRNTKIAVIEAKKRALSVTEGLAQAKNYAEKLQTRFAFSTNGLDLYRVDLKSGVEGPLTKWPSPHELWALAFPHDNTWRDRFAAVPFEEKAGAWTLRYYQANAVNRALERVANGGKRVLLTLATGTGKTSIAFQFVWKLFEAKWNLSGAPTRRPRILFLADRNNLADQAFNDFNSFAAFEDKALVRIKPNEIAKKKAVPKNAAVFFTIFQTFMSGRDENGEPAPYFGDYPKDFFDCIIIDECHRGGAKDESEWRRILDYFSPALQLGLTATPKRKINADTYSYFGEPAYVYSLKQGINDGYLTPFKVKQIATTLDEYVYTADDEVIEGEVDEERRYKEDDFNRIIEIEAREKARVKIFMDLIDQSQKTLVFCATQAHAAAARDLVNQMKLNKDPHYCERVTAHDGKIGDQFLEAFRDNEKTIPTILTTSQKLTTGVDARNVRNIVLMRPIKSMIEFKQIIGRGTRLYEGKDYFTIYDFVKAYELFADPEWDGEPPEPPEPIGSRTGLEGPTAPELREEGSDYEDEGVAPQKIKIRLADGKERTIQHMTATTFWSADGRLMSAAQFVENLFGEFPSFFKDEDELRKIWSRPDTRKALLEGLSDKGYGAAQLCEIKTMIDAQNSDVFDVLVYIAFTRAPKTREERAEASKTRLDGDYRDNVRAFLEFVLGEYVRVGEEELEQEKLNELIVLRYGTAAEAAKKLGGAATIREAFVGFQRRLYET
jgi:type I restriction enzyme R subunit